MKLLEFEHLIQINDPNLPDLVPMSREHLWEGLLFRSKYPGHFNAALECRLENLTAAGFVRHLTFGNTQLRDEVVLVPGREIRTVTGRDQPLFAESITRIEEPAAGCLCVRFIYRRDSGNEPGGLDVDEYLKAAYLQNDRDAIRRLRELASSRLPSAGSWLQ